MAVIRGAKGFFLINGKKIGSFDNATWAYDLGKKHEGVTRLLELRSGYTATLTQTSGSWRWSWCLFITQNYLYAIEMWLSGKAGFTVSLFTIQQYAILGPMFSIRGNQ